MKRFNFNKQDYDEVRVICKHDGEIAYCNALSVAGTCKCEDTLCGYAIAVIAKKDGWTQYLALED